ncbi:MAG: ABC transporter permease [Aggregatilineales bacterium]
MIRKMITITWGELYKTYTDRTLLLIMIITPLALSTIIGFAFSGFITGGGGFPPIREIPVAVVNLDEGITAGGAAINNGAIFVTALVPPADADPETLEGNPLFALTNAVALDDAAEARAGVDSGLYAVAIIIPADFSRQLTITPDQTELGQTEIEIYASPASPISAGIVRSVVEGFARQIEAGSVAIAASIDALVARAAADPVFGLQFGLASAAGAFNPDFSIAFDPAANPIRIDQQTIEGTAVAFNPFVMFGSAQAIFFMLFTAMGGANSILEERRTGTLQRLLASPTPRIIILLGRLIGTFVTCLVQLALLFIALTLISSLITGRLELIWGPNLLAVLAVGAAVAIAASGLGTLVAALVRTPEQGNVIGGVIAIMFGLFGGAFFDVQSIPALQPISQLTINYWGVNAFMKLSTGSLDILLNLAVLLIFGFVLFTAGFFAFNRRLSQ